MATRSNNRRQRQPANNRKLQRPNHYRRIPQHKTTTRNSSMRPIRTNRLQPRISGNDHKSKPQNIQRNPANNRPMDQPTKTHTIHHHHRTRPTKTAINATTPKQINPSAPSAPPSLRPLATPASGLSAIPAHKTARHNIGDEQPKLPANARTLPAT